MSDVHFTDESFETSHEINPRFLGIFGVAFIVLFFGTLVVLNSLYVQSAEEQYETKDRQAPTVQLDALRATEATTLNEYKALDKQTGRYQIPVDDARALVLRDYEAKRAAAAAAPAQTTDTAAPADPNAAPAEAAPAAAPADGAAAPAAPAPAEGAK
jgi:hypothetical protein